VKKQPHHQHHNPLHRIRPRLLRSDIGTKNPTFRHLKSSEGHERRRKARFVPFIQMGNHRSVPSVFDASHSQHYSDHFSHFFFSSLPDLRLHVCVSVVRNAPRSVKPPTPVILQCNFVICHTTLFPIWRGAILTAPCWKSIASLLQECLSGMAWGNTFNHALAKRQEGRSCSVLVVKTSKMKSQNRQQLH